MQQTIHRHDSLIVQMTWKNYRRMFLLGQDQECAETQAGPPVSVGSVWCSVVLPRRQWEQPHEAVTSGSPAPPSRHRRLTPATGDIELVFVSLLLLHHHFFSFPFSIQLLPTPLNTGQHPRRSQINHETNHYLTLYATKVRNHALTEVTVLLIQ